MHEYEIAVLKILKKEKKVDFRELEKASGIDKDRLMWALENLKAGGLVEIQKREEKRYVLTDEGLGYLHGMPEEKLAASAAEKPIRLDSSVGKIALSWAKRNGWVEIKNGKLAATAKWKADSSKGYGQRLALESVKEGKARESEAIDALIKRGLAKPVVKVSSIIVTITPKGSGMETEAGGIGAIAREALVSGAWKKERIRPYDINAPYEAFYPARSHPLHEMIKTIRSVWLRMGFIESVGPIVESSFWNFDALFSPQDHPTREMQDTFFLSNPKLLDIDDLELLSKVKRMHKTGWKQEFNEELSRQAVLRTHTTSVTVRGIQKFANALKQNYPLRLFSIGRVFRNETIDYKHLAEFYQTDGIIIGDNLSLANLIDVLKKFYAQLGMEQIRFKPSYFPFTEPSLEVQYYDEERGEELEIGGGGIIRQEITKAMGTDRTVLAWGLSVDRLMMHRLGIPTITELYKNDIGWLRSRPSLKV
ncbi:MAG: phenylalanine--tRNA ligase subunit alpha [Candidatus Micrarchaeota archaeon]|nr:phenylalanine--tRNA ligase subunit alpha [Candidatus Micrarchaeota archaeon]